MSAAQRPRRPAGAVPRTSTAWARGVMYAGLWFVLMPSAKWYDLLVGLAAVLAATWVSMRMLPPESGRLRFGVLLALMPHFLWESVLAAIDVARRALHPKLPLDPGYVACPVGFPPGLARNTFATITSLMPGTVPVGDGDELLVFHCLDKSQPHLESIGEEERLLTRALIVGEVHG